MAKARLISFSVGELFVVWQEIKSITYHLAFGGTRQSCNCLLSQLGRACLQVHASEVELIQERRQRHMAFEATIVLHYFDIHQCSSSPRYCVAMASRYVAGRLACSLQPFGSQNLDLERQRPSSSWKERWEPYLRDSHNTV